MKSFLPAFVLAVVIHGFFMAMGQKWFKSECIRSPVPRVITMTLAYQRPQSPPEPVPAKTKHDILAVKPVPVVKKEKPKPVLKPSVPPKKVSAPVKPIKTVPPPGPMPEPKPEPRPTKAAAEPPDDIPGPVEKKEVDTAKVIHNDFQAPPAKSIEEEKIDPGEESYRDFPETEMEPVEMVVPDALEKEMPAPPAQVARAETAPRVQPDTVAVTKARPVYRANSPPGYPGLARRRGYEGTVILEVLVDRRGRVGELRLFKSSKHRVLDRAAMASVKKWLFEPGTRDGVPIEMWVRIPIRFRLK